MHCNQQPAADPDPDLNLHLQEFDQHSGLEAENMVVLAGAAAPAVDPMASAGQGLSVVGDVAGVASLDTTFPTAADCVILKAVGTGQLSVKVGGATVLERTIDSAHWTELVAHGLALRPGTHAVELTLTPLMSNAPLTVDYIRWETRGRE